MATVKRSSVALPPKMTGTPRQAMDVSVLRQLWNEARSNSCASVPADEVLDRLERKYQALADAA